MWAELLNGALETVGEVATSITTGLVEIERENARQPEVIKAQEPIKARRTDGSTVVAQPVVQPPIDNKTMLIGGGLLLLVAVVMLKG
ncbi:hypothetical protein JL49_09045 [Pseudoalteromonas luteoviolacea]|nr:hypothetical protein JL49_09045 [Pseudoalteromonas luteoviolacea]